MPANSASPRIVAPFVLTSVLLLALCGIGAAYLYHVQSSSAARLKHSVGSRRAAYNLECVVLALLQHDSEDSKSAMYRGQLPMLVNNVVRYSDDDRETGLSSRIKDGYSNYRNIIASLPPAGSPDRAERQRAANAILDSEILRPSQLMRTHQANMIENSEQDIRESLWYIAVGHAFVGVVGSLGGLLLGFGMARRLRQRIHRLQVQVSAAADLLGPDLPSIVISGGDLAQLDEQIRTVAQRVEQVVRTLQQREREVLRSEQLAAVGQLAAGVAHEIRNPLTAIKMLVEMAREEAEVRHASTDDFRVIEDEIRRMERSLNSFLAFARPPRPEKSPQELTHLVEQTLSLVNGRAARQNVAIEFKKPGQSIVVEADSGQLQQVFVNLAFNSLDAMPEGGRLSLDIRPPTNGSVELEVHDTGPGIAAEMRSRLFEPFASNKETGLGLGLVISKRIVEDHGGSLKAQENGRSGASFVITLPALAT